MDLNTVLQNVPLLEALVAIVYWTSVAGPFIDTATDFLNGHRDALDGTDFKRLFTALLSVGVSFAFPAASPLLTLLQGATLAAIADGTYSKIIKRFVEEEEDLVSITQPTSHLGQKPTIRG